MPNFIQHQLKLQNFQTVKCLVQDTKDRPACAFVFGDNVMDGCLVRIHSRCLYGDVFHSADCDCGKQLELSQRLIENEGCGIIIYLDQEGRDCGLASKASGYVLTQTKQLDTFKAYNALGLNDDPREYSIAISILNYLNINSIRLLTNNPLKVCAIKAAGIAVERIPLIIPPTSASKNYLYAKKCKGHLF